ncbi:Reticulon-like protein B5 [Vitis vinifera]|uniref:Reticulon-like protein B5 n=1 Tax=Vitis vinifera TaxID=29760 RepID=A0A438G528_VITVI|nr:Reticulon-like protein B5 [Vitis vinifera]
MKMEEKGKGKGLTEEGMFEKSIWKHHFWIISRVPFSPSSIKAKDFCLFGREKLVNTVLGEGKRVDVFLWRNKKISAGVLGGAVRR